MASNSLIQIDTTSWSWLLVQQASRNLHCECNRHTSASAVRRLARSLAEAPAAGQCNQSCCYSCLAALLLLCCLCCCGCRAARGRSKWCCSEAAAAGAALTLTMRAIGSCSGTWPGASSESTPAPRDITTRKLLHCRQDAGSQVC